MFNCRAASSNAIHTCTFCNPYHLCHVVYLCVPSSHRYFLQAVHARNAQDDEPCARYLQTLQMSVIYTCVQASEPTSNAVRWVSRPQVSKYSQILKGFVDKRESHVFRMAHNSHNSVPSPHLNLQLQERRENCVSGDATDGHMPEKKVEFFVELGRAY